MPHVKEEGADIGMICIDQIKGGSWERSGELDEEVTPSPSMRKNFTRL